MQEILNDPENPLVGKIKRKDGTEISAQEIHEFIQKEYWKRWKYLLKKSWKPHIECSGLGYFTIEIRTLKARCYNIINNLRYLRKAYPDKYDYPETMIGAMSWSMKNEFGVLWKQLNVLRRQYIDNTKRNNESLIRNGFADRITKRYE